VPIKTFSVLTDNRPMSEPLYAGFWRRLVAAVLDQIILLVGRAFIYGALILMVYAMIHFAEVQHLQIVIFSILGVCLFFVDIWLTWIYFALLESSSYQGTPGKLAMGIRVWHKEKRALTFEEATVRYFAKILSRMTIMIGYILCAFSSRKQALHDFVAGSVLVVQRGDI
jgi:uncharacterized RDD family membrane protein YckC